MTEENEFGWDHDSLEVNENGFVKGSAYKVREDGYSVDIIVTSYEYNDGEDMNHVPGMVVSDPNGHIESEPTAHDTDNPEQAIKIVKEAGQNVYENLDDYIDGD